MFGTVARLHLKPGGEALLMAWSQALLKTVPGMRSVTVYRSTDNPLTLWISSVFDSEEAYRANAESPEQHRRWQQIRSLVEDDIEWNDGDILMHGNVSEQ